MRPSDRKGLTLVESLVSIMLLGAFLCGFLGAFFISRLSTARAQHRITAMNIIKDYMEREMRAGYSGGADGDGDYYETVYSADPASTTPSVSVVVDGRTYTLRPDPYYPDNVLDPATHVALQYQGVPYKIAGFTVAWNEDLVGGAAGPACSERATTYIFKHNEQ